ncbi:MAG: hypothetical protein GTO08_06955 [Deltaproteobacteria bacterium]|nr:hypothetical protein [Deltaproteobacteria bacterium]
MTGAFRKFSITFLLFLAASPLFPLSVQDNNEPRYELKVTVFPADNRISGEGVISIPHDAEGSVSPGTLKVTELKVVDGVTGETKTAPGALIQVRGGERIEFRYEGIFKPERERENIENVGVTGANIVDGRGIMLLSDWYPVYSGPCVFSLEVTLPRGFVVLSESNRMAVRPGPGKGMKTQTFDFPVAVSGITLVGGKHIVRKERYRGVTLRTYFFAEEDHLSVTYRENVKRYLDLYEKMLGPYPFGAFSVVENIFQTGYSFPTYTLLGSRVIPSRYVPEISLGHEFLHQWFGHFVEVDRTQGNWSEGLTTYLADHWYEELEGKGHSYRKKILVDYMNYVSPAGDIPVSQFEGRVDYATKAIGYGKTAMIFHMARKMLGDEAFFAGLRRFITENGFRKAGWDALKGSFTDSGEKDLARFFNIWTNEPGMAVLEIGPPVVESRGEMFALTIDVVQKNGPFTFNLPLKVETEDSQENFPVRVGQRSVRFSKEFTSRPLRIIIDEDYDTFRLLSESEFPPVISAFTGNKDNLVITPESEGERLRDVAAFFRRQGYRVAGKKEVTADMLNRSSYLVMSSDRSSLSDFLGFDVDPVIPRGGLVVKVIKNPKSPGKVIVLCYYDDVKQLELAYRKIFRYGNYSLLVFEEGKNTLKRTDDSARGIILDLVGKDRR